MDVALCVTQMSFIPCCIVAVPCRAAWVPHYRILSSTKDELSPGAPSAGGDRDFSHSFMRSVAVRLMLPGVRRFRAAGQLMSLARLPEGEVGENDDMVEVRFLQKC